MEKEKDVKQEKDEIPGFKGDGIKTTKVSNLKEKISLALLNLRDLATMELMLPVEIRMKKRLESIKNKCSAESIKVDGHWRTIAPEMHIMGLEGRKMNNNECEIRFSVYEVDEKGNKKIYEHYADITLNDGSHIKRAVSAEYKIEYEVIERIAYRKPIEREIVNVKEGAQ